MIKIVLDAGHGGSDPGAVGPTGLRESDVALKITGRVTDLLLRRNIDVVLTRQGDQRVSLSERVNIANKAKADYFVSIHINSATNPKATGTETFAFPGSIAGNRLATSIQKNLVQAIGLANRGVKYANFTVIANTNMPACLVEVAFINNPTEEKLLKQDEFIETASVGIAKGILDLIGLDFMEDNSKVRVRYKGKDMLVDGIVQDDKNYVGIRDLLEKMGYRVDWEQASQTVVVK